MSPGRSAAPHSGRAPPARRVSVGVGSASGHSHDGAVLVHRGVRVPVAVVGRTLLRSTGGRESTIGSPQPRSLLVHAPVLPYRGKRTAPPRSCVPATAPSRTAGPRARRATAQPRRKDTGVFVHLCDASGRLRRRIVLVRSDEPESAPCRHRCTPTLNGAGPPRERYKTRGDRRASREQPVEYIRLITISTIY